MKGLIVILSLFVSSVAFAEDFPRSEVVLDNSFFRISSNSSGSNQSTISLNGTYMYNITSNFQLGADVYYSKSTSSSNASSDILPSVGLNFGSEYANSFFINISAGSSTSSGGDTDNVYLVKFGKRIPVFPNVSWRPNIYNYKYEKNTYSVTVISLLSFSLSY